MEATPPDGEAPPSCASGASTPCLSRTFLGSSWTGGRACSQALTRPANQLRAGVRVTSVPGESWGSGAPSWSLHREGTGALPQGAAGVGPRTAVIPPGERGPTPTLMIRRPHPEEKRQLSSRASVSPGQTRGSAASPGSWVDMRCPPNVAHLAVNSRLPASPCLPTSSLSCSRLPHSLLFILSPTVSHHISYRSPGCFLHPEAPHVTAAQATTCWGAVPPEACLLVVPGATQPSSHTRPSHKLPLTANNAAQPHTLISHLVFPVTRSLFSLTARASGTKPTILLCLHFSLLPAALPYSSICSCCFQRVESLQFQRE
mgnify:CR=1 FL=1